MSSQSSYLHVVSDGIYLFLESHPSLVRIGEIGGNTGDNEAEEKQASDHEHGSEGHLSFNNGNNITVPAVQSML